MPHVPGSPEGSRVAGPRRNAIWWLPWLGAALVLTGLEASRAAMSRTIPAWFWQTDYDAFVYLALLIAAPLVWWFEAKGLLDWGSVPRWLAQTRYWLFGATGAPGRGFALRPVVLSGIVGLASLAASAGVGRHFDSLPPAYHDEYSYLFQAETFLAGCVSFPSHPAARLFDQMHVLNDGRFASRYFPGTGLWMAPFVALGQPYWGHWLAGAMCAVLMFWIGRELSGDGAGLIAGLLTALSPGMALFSNLLLAHHPTLVGLSVFLLGYLRLIQSGTLAWALASGTGLAFAMLCRPVTAAGVAFPFGVHLLYWAFRPLVADAASIGASPRHRLASSPGKRRLCVACMGLPLLCAGTGLFAYDQAITGSGWITPYSLYTDLHTPKHVYGFNNVERGKLRQGPHVIQNYDGWAENLTPRLALTNARTRFVASWKWTLGLIPLTLSLLAGFVLWQRIPAGAWLILTGIVSLHIVHIPYWFVGMEDHHYVFEATPLWAVWVAVVTFAAYRAWQSAHHSLLCAWWGALLTGAVAMNFTISSGVWSAPLGQGIGRVAFARLEHGRFLELVRRLAFPRPALVLVDPDPSDRHIDYVANSPALDDPILTARYLPELLSMDEVCRLFPNRSVFVYRIRNAYRSGIRVPEEEWRAIRLNPPQ